jgi:general secretion pathway protein F
MRYAVKAMRGDAVVDIDLEAGDAMAAREQLIRQGYAVLAVRQRGGGMLRRLSLSEAFPVPLFTVQLVALLDAGLNLVEALQALAHKEASPVRRRVLEEVLGALRSGESFSQAVARLPEHFPPVYGAIVRASERTGDLQRSLSRYLEYEQRFAQVRKKVAAALIYPTVLVVVGAAVLAFLMLYVVPRFARIYEDIAGGLPLFSAVLLNVGGWIERNGWSVLGIALALLALAGYALSRPGARAALLARLWRIPRIGEQLKLYQLARLYGTLGMLQRSGVPIVASMSMSSGLLAAHLRAQLARAQLLIEQGSSISGAMAAAGLSTPIADQMMAVGERSGQMGEMMERVAAFHDEDLARWLDWTMRLLEPALMAGIGIAIGLVVVLMYMPVFELASSLQ